MKIRTRLLYLYGGIILALLVVGALSIWAVVGWNDAAGKLSAIHAQSLTAERLRATIYQEIGYASDYLLGSAPAETAFQATQVQALNLLKELKQHSQTEVERDHIEGLDETQYELVWIVNQFIENFSQNSPNIDIPRALERLREIGDEVADDVAALSQYYNSLENASLTKEVGAGRIITIITILAGIMALAQFIILVFLLQRWLVRPIAVMNEATSEISSGNLDIMVSLSGKDEWEQLSGKVNEMVDSLKFTRQKLLSQERLAALGEIAAYSAHNIRNPLAGIRAAIQVIADDPAIKKSDLRESPREIIATIDKLDTWLKHLLAYARPLELKYSKTDINELTRQSIELAYQPFKNDSIKLDWEIDRHIPMVDIDPILIEQAIAAIATNSFQAIDENGEVAIMTAPEIHNNREYAMIRISDNGVGVPEDIQDKLFRIFVSSKENGTGLGLAQAKKIIDAHHGEIKLRSIYNKGTEVTLLLPVGRQGS